MLEKGFREDLSYLQRLIDNVELYADALFCYEALDQKYRQLQPFNGETNRGIRLIQQIEALVILELMAKAKIKMIELK